MTTIDMHHGSETRSESEDSDRAIQAAAEATDEAKNLVAKARFDAFSLMTEARKEAESILEEARAEAMRIVQEAEYKADSIVDAARLFIETKLRGFPVMDNNRIVGQLNRSDLLKALIRLGAPRHGD